MTPSLTMEARVRRALSRSLRPLQASARRGLLRAADSFTLLRPAVPDPKRVLIVRLDNIGDFIVWLDAARAIVEHFKSQGMHVTLLGSASWSSFASELAVFDEVLALDQHAFKHNVRYRRRLLTSVRQASFGTVLQPTMNRQAEMGDAVVRVTGATERIGVALGHGTAQRIESSADRRLYTKLLPAPPQGHGEMQANAWVVRELTGTNYQAKVAELGSAIDAGCLGDLAESIPTSPYVVLFPGASAAGRQWPQERFASLARRCFEESGLPVLICGGPGDISIAKSAAEAAGTGVTSIAGATNLQQLTTVIAGAQLLVSNETSAVHIAAAVGVPSVCIVGGGHFGRFLPYGPSDADNRPLPLVATRNMECFGCNWICKFHPAKGKPMPCIEEISVDTVWQLTAAVLAPQLREVETCV